MGESTWLSTPAAYLAQALCGERLAREAVARAERTDMLNAHGDALMDLAEVLTLAGNGARAELEQALALYERKGNVVMAERARVTLAELAS